MAERRCPTTVQVQATINAGKPTGGYKSNAFMIFDYQSPTDFKFACVNISNDKLEMGYRDADGWHVIAPDNAKLKPDRYYSVLLALNGTTATLVVDNKDVFSYAFAPRVDPDGFSYGLNAGLVGIGAFNSKARIDNVVVQILPPEITLEETEDFTDGVADRFTEGDLGTWQIEAERYLGYLPIDDEIAFSNVDLHISTVSLIGLDATLGTDALGGVIFDQYGPDDYKSTGV